MGASLRKTLHALSGQETLWFDVGMNPLNDVAIVRIDWPKSAAASRSRRSHRTSTCRSA